MDNHLANDCNSSQEVFGFEMKYDYIFWRLIVRACLLIILPGKKIKKKNITEKNAFLKVHHNS